MLQSETILISELQLVIAISYRYGTLIVISLSELLAAERRQLFKAALYGFPCLHYFRPISQRYNCPNSEIYDNITL